MGYKPLRGGGGFFFLKSVVGLVVPLSPPFEVTPAQVNGPFSCLPLPFSARGLLGAGATVSAGPRRVCPCDLRSAWPGVALGFASSQEEDVPILDPQKRIFQPNLGRLSRAHIGGRSRAQFPI